MIRMPPAACAVLCLLGSIVQAAAAQGSKYLEDFELIAKTAAQSSASLKIKKIDWKKECERLKPRFAACKDDVEHVKNVMELLAVIQDSHTDVWETKVDRGSLPSKGNGVYGGGLWIGWDRGLLYVQGVMNDHALGSQLPLGSCVVSIGDEPSWLSLARQRHRIARYLGISSDHSMYGSLCNRMFPFGDAQQIEVEFLKPDRKVENLRLPRWGPQGRSFNWVETTTPKEAPFKEGATSAVLKTDWCDKLGYLRITGGMEEETVRAFHAAFDSLKGMEALLLDCRSMGGGSDDCGWEMAGRLFVKAVSNGSHRLEPSGTWQFEGPVVMLQDEMMVSSAETFAWAVTETNRVISVGRNTGGWGIIPKVFECPSGLIKFRLGVNDRATPIRGIHTEGVGWPADVTVPYGPLFCAENDPVREVGLEILQVLQAGVAIDEARAMFQKLFLGEVKAFETKATAIAKKARNWKPDALVRQFRNDLQARIEIEVKLLSGSKVPDVLGSKQRLESLEPVADNAEFSKEWRDAKTELDKLKDEGEAQHDLLDLLGRSEGFKLSEEDRRAFLKAHSKTQLAAWLKDRKTLE